MMMLFRLDIRGVFMTPAVVLWTLLAVQLWPLLFGISQYGPDSPTV